MWVVSWLTYVSLQLYCCLIVLFYFFFSFICVFLPVQSTNFGKIKIFIFKLAALMFRCLHDTTPTFPPISSESLMYQLVGVFGRLQPTRSSFGKRDSLPLAIALFRSRTLICGTLYPMKSLPWTHKTLFHRQLKTSLDRDSYLDFCCRAIFAI